MGLNGVMLSWEHHPRLWHPSQPPGLGVALVWTPNPSMPVFKWEPPEEERVVTGFACAPHALGYLRVLQLSKHGNFNLI